MYGSWIRWNRYGLNVTHVAKYGNNSNIEEQTTYFQERLFKDVEMKYTPTDNKMIEDKLINLLIDHFDKMKIEDYDYTKSVGPEFWGGMAELFFISNID